MHESQNIAKSASESIAGRLLTELERAYDDVKSYIAELAQLLELSQPDRARLTTVRLKLAQLRLVQGAAVSQIYRHLIANSDETDRHGLEEMRSNHQRLLQAGFAHTTKWTLDVVEADWPQYQNATRMFVDFWLEKMNAERDQLYPLLKHTPAAERC